jgi:hypothetical protein
VRIIPGSCSRVLQRRYRLLGALLVVLVGGLSVSGQQRSAVTLADQMQGRVKILDEVGPWKMELLRQPGVLLAAGKNETAIGTLALRTYRIEEVTLRNPVRAEADGLPTQIDKAWRVTITGGPFRVRDAAAIIWIDDKPVGFGLEGPDLKSMSVVIFDESLLRNGASISLSYDERDDNRTVLPERIELSRGR